MSGTYRGSSSVSRRRFLAGAATVVAASAVIACGATAAPATSPPTAAPAAPAAATAPAAAQPTNTPAAAAAAPTAAPTASAAAPTTAPTATTAPAAVAAAQPAGNPTITFWTSLMGSKEAARTALTTDFETANPGLKIQHEGFFDIMQNNEKVLTAMVAGNPPDVISNHYYFVSNYANANALEALEPYMAASKLDPAIFVPSIYQLGQFKGKTYGLPIYADIEAYYYNTDIYTKGGFDPKKPPATWQDFIDVSQKLTVRTGGKLAQEGFSVPQGANEDMSNMWYALLLQAGGSFLNSDNTKAAFNDDAGAQALQLMVDLVQKYKVTDIGYGQGLDDSATPFFVGKSASIYADSTEFYYINKYAPKLNYAVGALPAGPKGLVAASQAFEMFIPKGSKNKDNAWKFVSFAMTPAAQIKFNKTSSHLACETEALKSDPFFSTDKNMKPFFDTLVNASKPFPITPGYADILSNLQQELQAAVLGKEDVKKALDNAATYANDQLSKI